MQDILCQSRFGRARDSDYLALAWVKFHEPILLPILQSFKILLEYLLIMRAADLPVDNRVVSEEPHM